VTIPFSLLIVASVVLFGLHFPFSLDVRATRPDLLQALRLEDQPKWAQWARLNRLLLPYWSFILRRAFTGEFANDPKLYRLAEVMYWVQLVQILSLATLILEFVIGFGGTVLHVQS